jgi:hypothetical protein
LVVFFIIFTAPVECHHPPGGLSASDPVPTRKIAFRGDEVAAVVRGGPIPADGRNASPLSSVMR